MKKVIRILAVFFIIISLASCLTLKTNNKGGNSESARSAAPGQIKK